VREAGSTAQVTTFSPPAATSFFDRGDVRRSAHAYHLSSLPAQQACKCRSFRHAHKCHAPAYLPRHVRYASSATRLPEESTRHRYGCHHIPTLAPVYTPRFNAERLSLIAGARPARRALPTSASTFIAEMGE